MFASSILAEKFNVFVNMPFINSLSWLQMILKPPNKDIVVGDAASLCENAVRD